ncbi:unnamed protein product [Closterium sp. NIES-64]|nr:unnamed protein product [Closterium sp. NIES-64]
MLGEMYANDMVQHQLGHPLEKRWVYPWEEEDEVPAVYAEPTQIELPAAREEAAVNKKREDLDWVEEAIERQRRRESYEREFGSGEFALMAATKEVGAETKTQGERSQEKAQGQPTEPAKAEGSAQGAREKEPAAPAAAEHQWEIGDGVTKVDAAELRKSWLR